MDVVSSFPLFVIRESAPYIRLCKTKDSSDCQDSKGRFWPTYLNDARKLYADDYTGSLTIGIAWDCPGDDTANLMQ